MFEHACRPNEVAGKRDHVEDGRVAHVQVTPKIGVALDDR